MASLVWTEDSLDDIEVICLFISKDAPRAAEVFAQRIFQAAETLRMFPMSGRVVPEFGRDDTRELIVGSYRLIYRLAQDEVQVLALHHGAQLLRDV